MQSKLARWLIDELEVRGWSQRELGRRADLSSTTVSQVLSDVRDPTWEFCDQVAKALGEPTEKLLRMAGLLPSLPDPIEEEQEAVGILRGLTDSARHTVMQMLRGVARAEDLPTGSELQVRYVGEEPETHSELASTYDPETQQLLQKIAEGLTKLSPESREELSRKYLMLLDVEETLEDLGQRQEVVQGE